MPTKQAEKAKGNPWFFAIGIAVVVMLVAWFFETRVPGVNNDAQAQQLFGQARDLSLKHLQDVDNGVTLTEPDKQDLRKAAVIFDSLAKFKPGDIRPWVGAAKIYQVLGNDDAAIRRLQDGLASMAKVQAPALSDTATEAHYLLSVSLFNKHDYPDSLNEINLAIRLLPMASPIYLSQRASVEIQCSPPKYGSALNDLNLALKVDPNHAKSRQLMKLIAVSATQDALDEGQNAFAKKDYKKTIDLCTKGLAAWPGNARLLVLRAASFHETGNKKGADEDMRSLVNGIRGKLEAGLEDQVVSDCTDALALAPGYPPLLDLRARGLHGLGRDDEAKADLAKIPSTEPKYPGLPALTDLFK